MGRKLVDADVAGPLLGLKKPALYDAVREKIVPAVHIGRRVRFDPEVLEEWIRRGGCKQPTSDTDQNQEADHNAV